jgi:hypothetical protein
MVAAIPKLLPGSVMPDLAKAAPALFVVLWSTGFIGARYAMPWAEPFTFSGCALH